MRRQAVHVVSPDQQADHIQRLSSAGIDTETVRRSGQLEVRSNTDTYLRDGHFDQERMLEMFKQLDPPDGRVT
jgi:hypothetical protein